MVRKLFKRFSLFYDTEKLNKFSSTTDV